MVDLHIHSTASDGTDTPKTIIEKCKKLALRLCSICDHDTIDAQPTAMKHAKALKLRYLTGVELSVKHEGELHILGYGINTEDEHLKSMMEKLREARQARVHVILEKLAEHNIKISYEDVQKMAGGNTLGRPHVALALIEKGYAADLQDAFNRYMGEHGLAYVKRRKLDAPQAIELILAGGGVPVIAHPKFIKTNNMEKLISDLKDAGIMGIEAYYPAHTDNEVKKYLHLAEKFGLLVTAGSDYHGKMRAYSALASEKRSGDALNKTIDFFMSKYAI